MRGGVSVDRGFRLLELDPKSKEVLDKAASGSEGGAVGVACRVKARLWYCAKALAPKGGFASGFFYVYIYIYIYIYIYVCMYIYACPYRQARPPPAQQGVQELDICSIRMCVHIEQLLITITYVCMYIQASAASCR